MHFDFGSIFFRLFSKVFSPDAAASRCAPWHTRAPRGPHLSLGRLVAVACMGVSVLTACGGGNTASTPASQPPTTAPDGSQPPTAAPGISLLAGSIGGPGALDGVGAAARFSRISDVAVDAASNVYVADANTIRKVTPAGEVSTLAGEFSDAQGIAVDASGTVYVADASTATIHKITPAGVVSTLAGTAKATGFDDGQGAAARFVYPKGIAVDGAGVVYVIDNGTFIRKISPSGQVSTLGGAGPFNSFTQASDITVDAAGYLYVADGCAIRKITPAGVVTTLAGTVNTSCADASDGTGAAARFSRLKHITATGAGELYVVDGFTFRTITPAGVVKTLMLEGSDDDYVGVPSGTFVGPSGLAVDGAGALYYVADSGVLRKVSSAGTVTTLAGTPVDTVAIELAEKNARYFRISGGLAVDVAGNTYVGEVSGFDYGAKNLLKRSPEGVLTTLAGGFTAIHGIVVDASGTAYVTDGEAFWMMYLSTGTNRANAIHKVTPDGVVTTLAGSYGAVGAWADGAGAQARFSDPQGIAVDAAGNLYVADTGNQVIRKITPAGMVSTLAGSAGLAGSADGAGAAARFNRPGALAVDAAGTVYVADTQNFTVRKISPEGVVSTLAGMAGVPGPSNGQYGTLRFNDIDYLTVDPRGNVYVAGNKFCVATDSGSWCSPTIRKITPDGVISVIAGGGDGSHSGTTLGALPGSLSAIYGIAWAGNDALVVKTDTALLRIQLP